MSNLNDAVKSMMEIDGAMGCAVVDYTSGMLLASAGSGVDF